MPQLTLVPKVNAFRGPNTPWYGIGSPLPGASYTTYASDGIYAQNAAVNQTDSNSLDNTVWVDPTSLLPVSWTDKTITGISVDITGGLQGFQTTLALIWAPTSLGSSYQLPANPTGWNPDDPAGFVTYNAANAVIGGGTWAEYVRNLLVVNDLLLSIINSPRLGNGIVSIDRVQMRVDYNQIITAGVGFAMEF